MAIEIDGFLINDDAIRREAERMAAAVRQEQPWLDATGQKLEAQDRAERRIIEHRLLFAEAQRAIQDLDTAALEAEYAGIAKRYGGEKAFLEKFKLTRKDLPNVKREIGQDMKFHRFLRQIDSDAEAPGDAELEAYYAEHPAEFRLPAQFKASHIVCHTNNGQDPVAAEAKARKLHERLLAGEAFETLADEDSDCPGKGGDLGWFPEGQMVEEFETVLFKLQPGEASGVFPTPFGFHIARLDERKDAAQIPYEDAKPKLAEALTARAREAAIQNKIAALRAAAKIVRK